MVEMVRIATLPRSVLVVDGRQYRQLSESPESVRLLEDVHAMVVPYSGKPQVNAVEVDTVRELLEGAGQLAPGALLVRNPYAAGSYEVADQALEAFALAKYHALANVAKHLGATRVSFVDARVDRSGVTWNAEAKAKTAVAKADAEFSKDMTAKLTNRLQGEMTFDGCSPDIDAAMASLRERNLLSDQQLRYLVDLRTGNNPVNHYKMTVSGTRESAANLRSALSLAASVPKAVGASAALSWGASSISDIEITTEITF